MTWRGVDSEQGWLAVDAAADDLARRWTAVGLHQGECHRAGVRLNAFAGGLVEPALKEPPRLSGKLRRKGLRLQDLFRRHAANIAKTQKRSEGQ